MKEKNENTNPPLVVFGIKDTMQGIIKVIGVGGGGCNAVRNMYIEGVEGVSYAVCNTDSQSLAASPVPVKIMLGHTGLGAGANPELGRKEAETNIEDIEQLLSDGTQMVFVTAGMGGGTGTGAAPVVANVAKSMGLFQRADNILKDAVKGISELITVHSDGSINLDFRDVETTLRNGGGSIMAMGRGSGSNRVEKAIVDALDSPLLYGNDIGKAKRILFNIYASEEHPIFVREMQEIDDFFDQLDPNIDVIWGTATDDSLGEDAKVTILATGLEDDLKSEVQSNAYKDDDSLYEDLISKLYKPMKQKKVIEVLTQELPFEVEAAKEPEPPTIEEVHAEQEKKELSPEKDVQGEPTILDRWKGWLMNKMKEVIE